MAVGPSERRGCCWLAAQPLPGKALGNLGPGPQQLQGWVGTRRGAWLGHISKAAKAVQSLRENDLTLSDRAKLVLKT